MEEPRDDEVAESPSNGDATPNGLPLGNNSRNGDGDNKQESAPQDNGSSALMMNGRGGSVSFANTTKFDNDDNKTEELNAHISRGSGDEDANAPEESHAMTSGILDSTAVTNSTSRRRGSSLELRRLPVNVLLRPEESKLFDEDLSVDDGIDFDEQTRTRSWLQRACLNSKFTLRSQMMLSFGVISTCTIFVVVIVCIAVSVISGEVVKEKGRETFDDVLAVLEGRAVRYIAEDLSPRLMMDDVVQILTEAVQDRFYGYPVYLNDSMVPFVDTLSGERKYPINGEPLPLDWQIDPNVNEDNQEEHVQGRYPWFGGGKLTTTNAVYYMQGSCDVSVTDPTDNTFMDNCTQANNDIETGGVYSPTPTNLHVHRAASDLTPLFKSLFEYHTDLKGVAALFSNGGAGATINYPGIQLPGGTEYTSIGCDWLKGPNPFDESKPILTPEEIDRCERTGSIRRKDGVKIPARLYSPLDRGWCRKFVQNKGKLTLDGPYKDAWSDSWLLTIGRAVHDRMTKKFIGTVQVDLVVGASLQDILMDTTITNNSEVSVVAFDDVGTVALSSAWDISSAKYSVSISELNVGVSENAFQEFRSLVDYDDKSIMWDPSEVKERYESYMVKEQGFQVKAYPIPPVPEEYDPDYKPSFLVVFSANEFDAYAAARNAEEQVDSKVMSLTILSIIVGLVGLAVVFMMLFAVSNFITLPLRRMNETAMRIIDNFGGGGEDAKIAPEDAIPRKQLVQTELGQIVKEFNKMVNKFSGGAMAKNAKVSITEVDNQFQLLKEFSGLYASRGDPSFKFSVENARSEVAEDSRTDDEDEDTVPPPAQRLHYGSNILSSGASTVKTSLTIWTSEGSSWFSSPLFRWILGLIVVPLLLSTVTISTIVTASVSQELPEMIDVAGGGLVNLQVSALISFANLRAGYAAKLSEQPVRDTHVLVRYASWLLFGGMDFDTFTELEVPGADECKHYEEDHLQCPYNEEHYICDCDWSMNNPDRPCTVYDFDTRPLQKKFWVSSSQDVEPNGDRSSTTHPLVANASNETEWFRSVEEVPGSPENPIDGAPSWSNSTPSYRRHVTPYGRLRAGAASPIVLPMFNYDVHREMIINNYLCFEADGMYMGYAGCSNVGHARAPFFESDEMNRAAEVRPELCPLGKHGYDPRCRGWYGDAKRAYDTIGTPAHVAPPYVFSGGGNIAQSCVGIIVDPNTKEFVGETLIDFESTRVFRALSSNRTPLATGGFHILVTTIADGGGGDGVIGPNHTVKDAARPIGEIVNAHNESCKSSVCGFAAIVKSMKAGEANSDVFTMDGPDGLPVTMHIAYSPVNVKMFRQVNASDFTRGVEEIIHTLYSVALVEPEASFLLPFEQAEEDIQQVIRVGLAVLAIVIVIAAILVIILSQRITVSMTEPMQYLLELIRQINRLDVGEEAPTYDMHGGYGSSEVLHVRLTMERLYKIIQCANAAYFAGETDLAYEVFTDALQLFTRLDNKKAMGVASNNLGNTMLTVFRTMEATGASTSLGMTKRQIIGKGMSYFHQAIQLGEQSYDIFYETEGWGPNCLHFMQHLSNRYFNRAMFLLTVKDHHEKPKEIEDLGLRDLQITNDMDVEIVDEGTQVGWGVRSAAAHFDVKLSRIRGHNSLLEMGYPDDWDVEEMLVDAFKILKSEIALEENCLFTDLSPAGRMQQIELELMRYYSVKKDIATAAKVAIRMMVEDEFVIPEAQRKAVDVLESWSAHAKNKIPAEVQRRLKMYQIWLEDACDELDTQRSSRDAFSVDKEHLSLRGSIVSKVSRASQGNDSGFFDENSTKGDRSDKMSLYSVQSFRQSMRGDLTMEAF
ncbi:expressed unknown protein [Seminavis robusta]|uniref:Uncharacterized protein n=1 Tax=Seminavis robusta TaxID=568900 RepID=A0A9N8H4A6_9STRA|nr:expressed unknown protein [Seminavis robusta]|eukprot:Sro57_g033410.1 n/a (1821) ;mRNA; f:85868-91498